MNLTETVEALRTFLVAGNLTEDQYHEEIVRLAHRRLLESDSEGGLFLLSEINPMFFDSGQPELMVQDPEFREIVRDLLRLAEIYGLFRD